MENFFTSFFGIGLGKINLFSIVIGMMIGLCANAFDRHKPWLIVVAYFIAVAGYFILVSGNYSFLMR